MTVVKRTTNELVIEDSDLPAYSVRFVRDAAGEQVVSVQTLDRGPAGLDHADILAALSWLADAAGVERYVPEPLAATCGSRRDDLPCLLAPGHPGWHKGLGAWWAEDRRRTSVPVCASPDLTTSLLCLLEPGHHGQHRHRGTVWSR